MVAVRGVITGILWPTMVMIYLSGAVAIIAVAAEVRLASRGWSLQREPVRKPRAPRPGQGRHRR